MQKQYNVNIIKIYKSLDDIFMHGIYKKYSRRMEYIQVPSYNGFAYNIFVSFLKAKAPGYAVAL